MFQVLSMLSGWLQNKRRINYTTCECLVQLRFSKCLAQTQEGIERKNSREPVSALNICFMYFLSTDRLSLTLKAASLPLSLFPFLSPSSSQGEKADWLNFQCTSLVQSGIARSQFMFYMTMTQRNSVSDMCFSKCNMHTNHLIILFQCKI